MQVASLTQNRNTTIDTAKGIGILLVAFSHLNAVQPLQNILYSFHIPLFFIMSGMFFNPQKYPRFSDFVKRRLKTLIYPYLFFAIISVLIYTLLYVLDNGICIASLRYFGKSLLSVIWAPYSLKMAFNAPLWFVPCLFAVECIYYFVAKIKNWFIFVLTLAVIVFVGWFTESCLCSIDLSVLPWNLCSACFALGFYAIGALSYGTFLKLTKKYSGSQFVVPKLFLAVICFACIVPLAIRNGHVTIGSRLLGNGFLFYLTGIVGSLGVLLFADLLKSFTPLHFFGKNSFSIMATHHLIQDMLFILYEILFVGTLDYCMVEWVPNLIVLCIILLLSVIATVIYNAVKRQFRLKW